MKKKQSDKNKYDVAINNGYNIIYLWENELKRISRHKNDIENFEKLLSDKLNEISKDKIN